MKNDDLIESTFSLMFTDPRGQLARGFANLGNAIARVGRRLDESVPTVDDGDEWFQWGHELGFRAGARQTLDIARLAFDAGKGATS